MNPLRSLFCSSSVVQAQSLLPGSVQYIFWPALALIVPGWRKCLTRRRAFPFRLGAIGYTGFERPGRASKDVPVVCLVDRSCDDHARLCRHKQRKRPKRHEAMRRAMAGRQAGRHDKRRDMAPVPRPMPSAAKFWSCNSRSHTGSGVAQTRFPVPRQQPAAPTPAATPSTAVSNQSVMKQCGAQWQSAKAAGTTNGQTWPQFLKECRSRLASTTGAPPQGGFAPATPAPAPATSPAPTQSGSLFPWQQPAAPAPAATGTGGFASPQEAQYRCPGATVVWVNEHSHIYHFPGTRI